MTVYYKLQDNSYPDKLWDIDKATWISEESISLLEDFEITYQRDIIQLYETLKFYNFNLGELETTEDKIKRFEIEISKYLNSFAQEKKYDNMDKARLAILSEEFKEDGIIANKIYDEVWNKVIILQEQIKDNTLTVEKALELLPDIKWE